MGHTRLGKLPRTRKWQQVVDLIAAGADAAQVADAVLKVAEEAFSYRRVSEDGGFNEAVWIITQLGLSAKSADPIQHLRNQGVEIHGQPTLTGLIAALSDRMDGLGNGAASPSDLGELAHRALVDAVLSTLRPKVDGQLFTGTPEVLTSAISDLRKPREFARLAGWL